MNEFRPSFAQYRSRITPLIAGAVVIAFIDYFRIRQPLPVYLAEVFGVLAVVALSIALYFRNTVVTSAPRSLTIRNALTLSHTVDDRNLTTLVRVDDYQLPSRSGTVPTARLFVLDGDGRAVLRWSNQTWTVAQMDELSASLGIPVESVPGRVSPKEFRARYPHAVSAIEAHPVLFALGIAAVIAAVVVVIVVSTISA